MTIEREHDSAGKGIDAAEVSPRRGRGITFFAGSEAPDLEEAGMMTPPIVTQVLFESIGRSSMAGGSKARVFFRGEGDNSFSLASRLVRSRFSLPTPQPLCRVSVLHIVGEGEN